MAAPSYVDDPATWARWDADECRLTAGVSDRLVALAGVRSGHRVIDLASGRGEPAVRAAHVVGPSGRVVGVDAQAPMLAMAAARAAREGVADRLSLHVADAHALEGVPEGPFDAALARWALTYLDDPVRALSALRARMAPGALLALATWASPERVEYWRWPRDLLAGLAPVPEVDLAAPGTFRHADRSRLAAHLSEAGWAIVQEEERHTAVMEAPTVDDLLAWCLAFGGRRLLAAHPPAVAAAWEARLRADAPRWRQADGALRLGGVTRLVLARAA